MLPGITHWNHPRFFAYFSISATPIAVVAEALAAALDVNAMLWRTSPAATELEEVVLVWLRDLLGLDAGLHGIVYDTASIGGFTALAAARESLGLDIRERGMAGRDDLPPLRVYLTEHTHSHIEKAAIALGLGRTNVVRVPVDDAFAMRPDALDAMLADDRARGMRPMCIAATVGTTSTTSSDPVTAIGAVAKRHGVWLHVDAAYAGPVAMLPEFSDLLAGCTAADSVVVNPHKWLFVPIDLSVLYVRDLENLRRAFALVADYLVTPETGVRNYMDYGLQLGRRFRALKLWFAMRHLGVRGMRDLLRGHVALAQTFAAMGRCGARLGDPRAASAFGRVLSTRADAVSMTTRSTHTTWRWSMPSTRRAKRSSRRRNCADVSRSASRSATNGRPKTTSPQAGASYATPRGRSSPRSASFNIRASTRRAPTDARRGDSVRIRRIWHRGRRDRCGRRARRARPRSSSSSSSACRSDFGKVRMRRRSRSRSLSS